MRNLLITIVFLFSTACTSETPAPVLRIASDATFAPFHLVDGNGTPTGFDIELARAVAREAGFDPQVVVLDYAALFSGLKDNTHDVVAATTGITPEREEIYLFSEPYFATCQVAVVRIGPGEARSVADLGDKRIGASGAGTSFKAMQTLDGELVSLADGQGQSALADGRIDAWIVDEFDGVGVARASQGKLLVLPEPVALERYGFVLGRDQQALKSQLDRALAVLMERGEVDRLKAEFGIERGPDWPVAW